MQEWLKIALAAASSGLVVLILIITIQKRCCRKKRKPHLVESERAQNLQTGIAKLHHVSLHHLDRNGTKKTNYYVFKQGASANNFFNWSDHPSLVTDAVENGWSRFAFTSYAPSPSVRSAKSLLGACAVGNQLEANMSWEICQGSADFMQKIKFNSGVRKLSKTCVIKTSLPLPGPPLGNSSFPQEAYFEITILPCHESFHELMGKAKEDKSDIEKIKLIREDSNSKTNSESLVHVISSHKMNGNQESKDTLKNELFMLSIGLTGGASLPPKLPGSYKGSIGFNSNGSVFLDGMKLVYESEKEEWGRTEKVIGCGYNPSQKKVFFTVDSLLVHEIHCKTEEYGSPLYPTLAANGEIGVVVNLGQSVFRYPPANLQRTPNPCFIGHMANSPVLGYEDSKELFSMGRIDAQWLNRSSTYTRSNNNTVNSLKQVLDYDLESEGDLFEIALDNNSSSTSPNPL